MTHDRRRFMFLRREAGGRIEVELTSPHASDSLIAATEAVDCPDCLFDLASLVLQRLVHLDDQLDPYVLGLVHAAASNLALAGEAHFELPETVDQPPSA